MSTTLTEGVGTVTSDDRAVFLTTINQIFAAGLARGNAIGILNLNMNDRLAAAKALNLYAKTLGLVGPNTNIFNVPVASAQLEKVLEQSVPTPAPSPTSVPAPISQNAAINNLQAAVTALQQASPGQGGNVDLTPLKTAVNKNTDDITGLKTSVNKNTDDITGLKTSVNKNTDDITGLETTVNNLNTGLNDAKQAIKDLGDIGDSSGLLSITTRLNNAETEAAQNAIELTALTMIVGKNNLENKASFDKQNVHNGIVDLAVLQNTQATQDLNAELTATAALLAQHKLEAKAKFDRQRSHNVLIDLTILKNKLDGNKADQDLNAKLTATTALLAQHEEEHKGINRDITAQAVLFVKHGEEHKDINKDLTAHGVFIAQHEEEHKGINKDITAHGVFIAQHEAEHKAVNKDITAHGVFIAQHEAEHKAVNRDITAHGVFIAQHEAEHKGINKDILANGVLLVQHELKLEAMEQKNAQAALLLAQHIIEDNAAHAALSTRIDSLGVFDGGEITALTAKNTDRDNYYAKFKGTAYTCTPNPSDPTSYTKGAAIATSDGTELGYYAARDLCQQSATDLTKPHYIFTLDINGHGECALLGMGDFMATCDSLLKGLIIFH